MFLYLQIIDPFVEVEIIGLPVDCTKQQTRVVDDNGMCTKGILQYKSQNKQSTISTINTSTVLQVSTQCGRRHSSLTLKCRRSPWFVSKCGIMILLDEISLDRGLLLSPVWCQVDYMQILCVDKDTANSQLVYLSISTGNREKLVCSISNKTYQHLCDYLLNKLYPVVTSCCLTIMATPQEVAAPHPRNSPTHNP